MLLKNTTDDYKTNFSRNRAGNNSVQVGTTPAIIPGLAPVRRSTIDRVSGLNLAPASRLKCIWNFVSALTPGASLPDPSKAQDAVPAPASIQFVQVFANAGGCLPDSDDSNDWKLNNGDFKPTRFKFQGNKNINYYQKPVSH